MTGGRRSGSGNVAELVAAVCLDRARRRRMGGGWASRLGAGQPNRLVRRRPDRPRHPVRRRALADRRRERAADQSDRCRPPLYRAIRATIRPVAGGSRGGQGDGGGIRSRPLCRQDDRPRLAAARRQHFHRSPPLPVTDSTRNRGPYSAACFVASSGRQRSTGLRAAAVSSRRRRGVRYGAPWNHSAASPALARRASALTTAMKWSSASLLSVSVGSISSAPWTTSGKYIVIG